MPGPPRTPCSSRTMPSALTWSHRSFTRASPNAWSLVGPQQLADARQLGLGHAPRAWGTAARPAQGAATAPPSQGGCRPPWVSVLYLIRSRNTVPLAAVLGAAMRMLSTFAVGLPLGKSVIERTPLPPAGELQRKPEGAGDLLALAELKDQRIRQSAVPCTPTRRSRPAGRSRCRRGDLRPRCRGG